MWRFVVASVLVLASPAPSAAWGFEAHQFIMDRAIALLPAELRPLFEANRAMVVERAIDPDTWRTAGFGEENKHHFLDLDWEGYGKYPFAELPRDYTAAVAKFGHARIEENGTVPWRVEEYHGNLRRAFESYARRGAFGRHDLLFFSAALAHYRVRRPRAVSRGCQLRRTAHRSARHPCAVRVDAVRAVSRRVRHRAAPIAPIRNPRDFIFDTIIEGTQLVPAILKADLEAIGPRDVYDDAYFSAFFGANRRVLERRLGESISAVAAMIAGAWEAGGRPPAPSDPPPLPAQRRPR